MSNICAYIEFDLLNYLSLCIFVNSTTKLFAVNQDMGMTDALEHLERLARLKDQGHVTEDEFQAQKSKLLGNGLTHTINTAPQASLNLWNPTAAVIWSLFLSPFFGMVIHWRNWRTLREGQKSRYAMLWIVGGLFFLFLLAIVEADAIPGGMLLLFIGWYFLSAKQQIKFVSSKYSVDYPRRSWLLPLGIPTSAIICVIIAGLIHSEDFDEATGLPRCDSEVALQGLINASKSSPGNHLTGLQIVTVKEMRQRGTDPKRCVGEAYLNTGENRQIYFGFEESGTKGEYLVRYEIPSL